MRPRGEGVCKGGWRGPEGTAGICIREGTRWKQGEEDEDKGGRKEKQC